MNNIPKFSRSTLEETFLKPFVGKLEEDIRQQQELLRETEKIYSTFHEKLKRLDGNKEIPKYINETDWLKSTLYDLLENEFPEKREILFEEEFKSFYDNGIKFIEKLPVEIIEEQSEDRFQIQANDSFGIKFQKPIKNLLFQLSTGPQKLTNLFRKEKRPIHKWKHTIPLRSMAKHFFINSFASACLPYFKELQQLKCDALNLKWSIDRDINIEVGLFIEKEENGEEELLAHIDTIAERNRIEENINNLDRKLKEWESEIGKILDDIIDEFNQALEKVDTIELNKAEYSDHKLDDGQKLYQKNHLRLFNGWRNTLFAQLDDFQVDIELYHIKYSNLLQFFLLQSSCRLRVNKTIKENIKRITAEFDQLIEKLGGGDKDIRQIEEILKNERIEISRKLEQKIIPEAIEAIYNQNLPYLLDRLEQKVKGQIDKMKPKRIIYSNNDYNAPISKNELSHFNPRELVLVDTFAKFSESNKKLKSEVVHQLERLQINIKELSGIVDYNLDSAISSVKENEKQEDIKSIALEGVERTQAKVANVENELQDLQELINGKLREAIDNMNIALIKLTDNENITDLRLKLARAKAVEKTNFFKRNLISSIRHLVPLVYRFLRSKYFKVVEWGTKLLKKINLIEGKEELTAELSDFLVQAEEAIEKLPYVYRRLYRVTPLEEEVFFEGRNEELMQLKKAYQNWKEGMYSTCSLVGEKGSGASSLVNFFLKDIASEKILRHKMAEAYSSKEDFISFFRILLEKEDIEDFEDIVKAINNKKHEVLILEDVQHFYLKKIRGFEALNLLFELISQTGRSTFWIIEITTYTWTYLQKTINIGRYFKHTINLNPLSEDQIIQLIMKRHRVSGYNLQFKAVESSKVEQRKLRRLNEEEEQEYLKKSFFTSLNQFAQSNISLALLYWLRSTQDVKNNTIIIGKLANMKFDFLSNLNEQYIFTLHALIIHDSLDIEEHALLFHQSERQSRMNLMVLEDNGILKSEEGRYHINRLLYRQTVNVLRSKNIIH